MSLSQGELQEASDEELLAQFQAHGDQRTLAALYDRYLSLLYGICLKYFPDTSTARDACSDLYEVLLKKVPGQEIQAWKPWLYVVAKNHCLMALRKQGRTLTTDLNEQVMQLSDSWHLEDMDEDRLRALRKCIEQLPPQQRACITSFYLDALSYADIATAMQDELGKVRSHIQNGRRNLKLCMQSHQDE